MCGFSEVTIKSGWTPFLLRCLVEDYFMIWNVSGGGVLCDCFPKFFHGSVLYHPRCFPVCVFVQINTHILRVEIWQVLLLAGPGVLITAFSTAIVCKFAFGYDWTWSEAILFGGIVRCATTWCIFVLVPCFASGPASTHVAFDCRASLIFLSTWHLFYSDPEVRWSCFPIAYLGSKQWGYLYHYCPVLRGSWRCDLFYLTPQIWKQGYNSLVEYFWLQNGKACKMLISYNWRIK